MFAIEDKMFKMLEVLDSLMGTRGPLKLSFHSSFKLAHSCQKKLKLHTNSLNKLLLQI
jgi:hypothetical protein